MLTAARLQNFRVCAGNEESTVFTTGLVFDDESFDGPYPFGLDPIWHGTRTELTFFNSLKMKMSIVMGVVHMTLGIVMSLFNHLYFRDRLSLIFEFFPQMVFLWGLFGYLGFLIVFKWIGAEYLQDRADACDVRAAAAPDEGIVCPVGAPSLFSVMIDMVLSPGNVTTNEMYDGQALVQVPSPCPPYVPPPRSVCSVCSHACRSHGW